jgi:adenosylcobinamide kinase/adenosylcobinamide-phosphate guanylyltransferase
MFVLVTGGSGSGKSAFAEKKVTSLREDRRFYVATMRCFDEEGRKRVARHRKMREDKQFETLERYTDLKNLILPGEGTVLLECMSNLVANELFEENGAGERTVEEVLLGIRHLLAQSRHLVVVTNEIFSDGIEYGEETLRYQSYLGKINQGMAEQADEVYEVVYGIPLCRKGEKRK